MHTTSTKFAGFVFSTLTWFPRKGNTVSSSQFVQDNVPDKSSIFSGNLYTALLPNGISFSTILLLKISYFGFYNGLVSYHILVKDL